MVLDTDEADTLFEPSHELEEDEQTAHEEICAKFKELYDYVSLRIFDNDARGQFVNRLAEAKMWANRSLVVGEYE